MRWRGILVGALALLALGGQALQLDQDELDCEQAAKHLARCCADFDPHAINCTRTYCGGKPVLTDGESRCIVALDCATIDANGVCRRVESLGMTRAGDGSAAAPVCP